MAWPGWTTARLAAAGVLLLAAGRSDAAETFRLTVDVANLADIVDADLARAEEQVTRMYAAIGVDVEWVSNGWGGGAQAGGSFRVRLQLLSQKGAAQIAAENIDHDMLGFSVAPARMAYVFCSRVLVAMLTQGRAFAEGLGTVMAHEMGHLLLPGQGHTATGLMCPAIWCWGNRPFFGDRQVDSIRALLNAARDWSDDDLARELWKREHRRTR
jgi:hypothetical protein